MLNGAETANDAAASIEFTKTSQDNETNKTINNPVATATMKNTGIPIIAILLVLLSILGISIYKKQN